MVNYTIIKSYAIYIADIFADVQSHLAAIDR